jgi:hypothetical protein
VDIVEEVQAKSVGLMKDVRVKLNIATLSKQLEAFMLQSQTNP